MSIRVRSVDGITVALCAVESDPEAGDLYLDDAVHAALAAKFADDWQGRTVTWADAELVAVMETQKVRDAEEELIRWLGSRQPGRTG